MLKGYGDALKDNEEALHGDEGAATDEGAVLKGD